MDTTHAQALSLFVRFIPEDYHVLILASSVAVVSIHQRHRIAASLKVSNDVVAYCDGAYDVFFILLGILVRKFRTDPV